jgi:hypothetical protein
MLKMEVLEGKLDCPPIHSKGERERLKGKKERILHSFQIRKRLEEKQLVDCSPIPNKMKVGKHVNKLIRLGMKSS